MARIKPKHLILGALCITIVGAFLWIRSYVFDNVAASLQAKIEGLKLSGFNIRYDSISVNWRTNVIEIDSLLLEKNPYDTTCLYPEFISIGKVRAEGLSLFQLIFHNILTLETLSLDGSRAVIRQNSMLLLDSAGRQSNEFTLRIENVFIRSTDVVYTDSVRCRMITGYRGNLAIAGLNLDFKTDKTPVYDAEIITLDSAELKAPTHFYTFRILQARMNIREKSFRADSIKVVPDYSKLEFSRKHGFEIDRFEATIPYIKAENFSISSPDTAVVKASLAEIQFYLKVFRDKRLPFIAKEKMLPVAQIRSLPFGLAIDSLKILKSYVQYEEYAEGAKEPGRIFFDNLYAVMHNITNLSEQGSMRLTSQASFLGKGDIELFATFPFEKNKRSSMRGSIKDFSLPEINSMLTPTTQIKVESGNLKELLFNFTFNSVRSDGEIELNYENLKLITFKDEEKSRGEEPEKDNFKTFIMNLFVFRKNMNEDVPEDKRKGTIMYLRDDTRSVFNFWSKSLVSGLKSAYNLDKMEAKKTERESRKEERLSRREARKQKRAERKRDRG